MRMHKASDKAQAQRHPMLRADTRQASQDDLHHISATQRATSTNLVLKMQRMYGNHYMQGVLASARKGECQTKASPKFIHAIQRARGSGQSLDKDTRVQMEAAFDSDFSRVRIHTGLEADTFNRAVNVRAFTTGQDIFFRDGEYTLSNSNGRELLAHELTHIVQKTGRIQPKLVINRPGDVYEQEADRVARAIVQREQRTASERASMELVQRQIGEEEDHDLVVQAKAVPGQIHMAKTALNGGTRLQLREADESSYKVQHGDTLQKIAAKFGVTVMALKARNSSKLKTWHTPRGNIQGFEAGKTIVIPASATTVTAPTTTTEEPSEEKSAPMTPAPSVTTCEPKNPIEVISCHNELATFGKGVVVRVTSTKRDPKKQLDILRNYCKANKAALDEFAENTDWLKGELDWKALETCSLSDQKVWLPFFFALFYGGGGPGTKSDARTLPLVGSPVQAVWKGKTANASPHLAGKAMDVKDGDLNALSTIIKTGIPEFGKSGEFPVRSTQIENVAGQKVVHINFEKVVF